MTNEEKAKELGKIYARQYRYNHGGDDFVFSNDEIEKACMQMAEWKQNQMIEKGWDWFMNKCGFNDYNTFKKAMEQ